MPVDPLHDPEIDAWLDGELDLERAHAVERRLAGDQRAAAQTIAMMSDRSALRLMAAIPAAALPSPAIATAARHLGRRLGRPPFRARRAWAGGIAATLALAFAIPQAAAERVPPDYVVDAVSAYRTGLLRQQMDSQVETPVADPHEIAGATRLRVPQLPRNWRVTDVQLVPADHGPAIQIMARMPDARVVSVFAMRADAAADADMPSSPETVAQDGGDAAAFWTDGDMSYALIGAGTPEAVDQLAERVAAEQIG